jgi:hypothetical protein
MSIMSLAGLLAAAAPLRADALPDASAVDAEAAEDSRFSIGVRVENGNHRSFRQVEPTTGEVRTYDARVYGGVGVELGYDQSFAEDRLSWSLHADYWRSLFFTSGARRLGRTVDTTAQRAGAVAGLSLHPRPTPDSASIGLLAGIFAMGFDFAMPRPQTSDDSEMQLATGNYTLVSAGVGARVPVSALAFSVRGSYLLGLDTGAFGGRKALTHPDGFDALALVEYRLLPWLDVTLRGGVTLLWLSLAPLAARPEDAPATIRDLYLALGLGVRARL